MSSGLSLTYLFFGWILGGSTAQACSVCFANGNAADAEGINMAILSLLFVICAVLIGFAAFFIYLKKKAAQYNSLHQDNSGVIQ